MGFFPPYFAAPVINQELLEENPELEEILNQLAGTIDDEAMQDMNYQVDEEGKEPRDVARAFLEEQGIIGGDE
jgi:glycine betaine/choline ABC-type transport system substrate-binding protein